MYQAVHLRPASPGAYQDLSDALRAAVSQRVSFLVPAASEPERLPTRPITAQDVDEALARLRATAASWPR